MSVFFNVTAHSSTGSASPFHPRDRLRAKIVYRKKRSALATPSRLANQNARSRRQYFALIPLVIKITDRFIENIFFFLSVVSLDETRRRKGRLKFYFLIILVFRRVLEWRSMILIARETTSTLVISNESVIFNFSSFVFLYVS